MGAQASNNFSEDLVNGSNPRYTYSQPSIAEQVAWQVKKEEEARQSQINDTMNRMQKAQYDTLHSPVNTYTPSSTPSSTPSYTPSFSTPSLTSISTPSSSFAPSLSSMRTPSPSYTPSLTFLPAPSPSFTPSVPTFSFSSASTPYSPGYSSYL